MESVLYYFPLVLYSLGTIALIIVIILGIKVIKIINKANVILDDAYNKTKSLTGLFHTIDNVTDFVSNMSDSIISNVTGIVTKLIRNKKKKEESEEDDDE